MLRNVLFIVVLLTILKACTNATPLPMKSTIPAIPTPTLTLTPQPTVRPSRTPRPTYTLDPFDAAMTATQQAFNDLNSIFIHPDLH